MIIIQLFNALFIICVQYFLPLASLISCDDGFYNEMWAMIWLFLFANAAAEWHFMRVAIYSAEGVPKEDKIQHLRKAQKNFVEIFFYGNFYRFYSLMKLVAMNYASTCFDSPALFYILLLVNFCVLGFTFFLFFASSVKEKDEPAARVEQPEARLSEEQKEIDEGHSRDFEEDSPLNNETVHYERWEMFKKAKS